MASNALAWEIDGLPVDCRAIGEVTREDLLSYYGRVAAYGRLEMAFRQRVVAITPSSDGVRVDVETERGAGHWVAERILVTPWYCRRRLELTGLGAPVQDSVGDAMPSHVDDVVVVGGGVSGLEVADLMMRSGLRVTLLKRSRRDLPPEIASLAELSGSRVLRGVEGVGVARRGVLAVAHEGTVTEVRCTVAFNCTGQQINADLLRALHTCGILSGAELRALEPFRQATLLDAGDLSAIAAQLPPLGDALFAGRRGVHFAGTLFHIGGVFGGGILYSIETAKWAVAAVAGVLDESAPPKETHLPAWFLSQTSSRDAFVRGPRWSDHLAAIIPVPIPTWSRGTRVFEGESSTGKQGPWVSQDTRAIGAARDDALTALRSACYESASVAELGGGLDEEDRQALLLGLVDLWYNNGLTWIPPRTGGC